jgi:hypothetical protein
MTSPFLLGSNTEEKTQEDRKEMNRKTVEYCILEKGVPTVKKEKMSLKSAFGNGEKEYRNVLATEKNVNHSLYISKN